MLRTIYTNYIRKISEIDPEAVAGAIRAAINVADINREAPDSSIIKKNINPEEFPCRVQDNCKSDLYLNESDYEGRGVLMSLLRALHSGNKGGIDGQR